MKKEGYVSLWIGNSHAIEPLRDYIRVNYNEDGDSVPSNFAIDYLAPRFDPDFTEVLFHKDKSNSIRVLLNGCSYGETVIPAFEKICYKLVDSYNSVLLIYNYDYSGDVKECLRESICLKFIGTVKYQ